MSFRLTRRRAMIGASGALAGTVVAAGVPGQVLARSDGGSARVGPESWAGFVVDGCNPTRPSETYLAMLKEAGVHVWHASQLSSLPMLEVYREFFGRNADKAEIAGSTADIVRIVKAGKIAAVFGWQTTSLLEDVTLNDWYSRPPNPSLDVFHGLGLRIMSLAYNVSNMFGGGCLDPTVGLTRAGRALVEQMQKQGILVDIGGHIGEQTTLDAIEVSERPVTCSHANVKTLNDNPRNVSDRVIDAIAGTGGVIGVTAVEPFMTWGPHTIGKDPDAREYATVKRFVDDLDYLKKRVGADHVGLGPDFTYGQAVAIDPEKSFIIPPEVTYEIKSVPYVKGFSEITELANVSKEMRRRGWKADEINKVFGENWMRLYDQAWN